MHVSVETTRGLERRLTVKLPSERFEQAVEDRLNKLAKTTKLAGFRPGKVPLKVIRQKFGGSVRDEILSDLVRRSYGDALVQEKLKPAGMPQIDAKPPMPGDEFKFIAVFEIYPEVKLGDLTKLAVTRPLTDIAEPDLDAMLERLRRQRASWQAVARPARLDDQVRIDFTGTIDGVPFEGGKGEDMPLVLGSKRMIEGFEDQLLKISAGETRTLKVKFPKDYGKAELQGKKAEFEVVCRAVEEQVLPELDETFVKSFGAADGSLDTLKQQLRDHMARERDENINIYLKRQVMDGLLKQHTLELPNVLVDQEVQQLQQQTFERLGLKEADVAQLPREPFEEEARRRVALGLLVGEIIKQRQLKADPGEVKTLLMKTAANYQNPEQMVQYYLGNRQAMQHFESVALEQRVVDDLLSAAKVTEKSMSFDELLQANQQSARK
jgi:trigger factor